MPVFNVERYLTKALDSIISQTIGFENIEVILVDDKSTDKSTDIIREYANEYENFKAIYLDKCSGFPGKPRNVGLENATAPYIMFLDSDDYLESAACEKLYETIIKEDADIVSGSFTKTDKDGTEKINRNVWASTLTSPDLDKKDRMKRTDELLSEPDFKFVVTDIDKNGHILGNANVWGKIFKRSLIMDNNIEFPEDIVAQDSVFLLESFYNAEKIVFIRDIIVHYNNRRNKTEDKSVTHVKSKKNLYGRIQAYDLMYDLSKQYSKEDIFYKNLLSLKLNYWYKHYLLKTPMKTNEIENIFTKYSHLFSECYKADVEMSESSKEVFKEIHEDNIVTAAKIVSKNQQKPSRKSTKAPFKNRLKQILKK